jgi:hypothetical protein
MSGPICRLELFFARDLESLFFTRRHNLASQVLPLGPPAAGRAPLPRWRGATKLLRPTADGLAAPRGWSARKALAPSCTGRSEPHQSSTAWGL